MGLLNGLDKKAFDYLHKIGKVLVEMSDGFSVYLEYCDNYTKSEKLYTELMETNP